MVQEILHHEKDLIERRHHQRQLWTRFGTIVLGLWLLASPETFGYINTIFQFSDWISGLLLILFGILSLSFKHRYWIWGGCIIGIWLQFAPLAFWAKDPVVYVNNTLIGVLAIAFTILVPLRPKELEIGPQIPPGWTYNPSSWQQRIPIVFLAILGWFIARYMASYQLGFINYVWDPFFGLGTQKVITSMISQEFPVSDAGLGAMAYSLEAIMGVKGGVHRWHTMPWIVIVFGILVVPVGFVSIVLIMLQPIAVGAWCGLCLIIATCMLIMLALSVDEVVACLQFLARSHRERKPFLKTFFYGSTYSESSADPRNKGFQDRPRNIFKSMFWGITFPWNLIVTALLGIWLLFSDDVLGFHGFIAKNSNVCGALITTFSIISLAEVIRSLRFINILVAIWAGLVPWLCVEGCADLKWNHGIVAVLVILLSLIRGRVKEKYGSWSKMIY